MDKSNHPVMEYAMTVLKLWGKQISGPILAFVALVLGFASAHYANSAQTGAWLVKFSAWLTGSVAVCLIFVAQYEAWKAERDALDAERQRHTGADIRGTIKRGYLDLRTFPNSNTAADWIVLTHGCSVKFYVEAVNHNDWATWFKPRETKLELSIGEACFHGTWERVSPYLAVHDDDLEYRRLADLFDYLLVGRFSTASLGLAT